MLFRKAMPAGPVEYIVAGLGNPGKEYEGSRHNAGFMGMEALADRLHVKIDRVKFKSYCGQADIGGRRTLLLMEELAMTLVFALAAAICLRAFALADGISRRSALRDTLLRQAESMAAVCQWAEGDLQAAAERFGGQSDGAVWRLELDAAGDDTEENASGWVEITLLPEEGLLGRAQVRAESRKDGLVGEFPLAWQREAP